MTCSPCNSVLNPQFQKMSSIKWTIPLFKTWTFLTNRPCMSNLKQDNTRQNQTWQYAQKGSAYRSISAFSCASRLASSVGCHKPMSKCFLGKGAEAPCLGHSPPCCDGSMRILVGCSGSGGVWAGSCLVWGSASNRSWNWAGANQVLHALGLWMYFR